MVGKIAGVVAAASALTANAMLLPPNVATADSPVQLELFNSDWQAIKLPCPDCVMPNPKSEVKEGSTDGVADLFIQGGSNSLLVNITSIMGGHGVGLLEDYPLYPPLRSFRKASVQMVPSEATLVELKQTNDRTHSVEVSRDMTVVFEDQGPKDSGSILRIEYQIEAVNNQPVTVDKIEITALKDTDDMITLIDVERIPSMKTIFDDLPGAPTEPAKEVDDNPAPPHKKPCDLPAFLCQFRDAVEDKMSGFKPFGGRVGGCHGRKGKGQDNSRHLPGHRRPPHFGPKGPHHGPDGPEHHEGPHHGPDGREHKGHHGRPHHHHKGHHFRHHHSFVHAFFAGIMSVLVPMFTGIALGFFIAAVGTIVGRLIAFVWIRFVRGGQRGYASVRLSEEEAENAEVKEYVVEEVSEPLPLYEEAPKYEEKEQL